MMAAIIGGVAATGIELQDHLHELAIQWHEDSACGIPGLALMLQEQKDRLIHGNFLTCPKAVHAVQLADVIFTNNLKFVQPGPRGSASLNGKLATHLAKHMRPDACIVSSAELPHASLSTAEFQFGPDSVSWIRKSCTGFITTHKNMANPT